VASDKKNTPDFVRQFSAKTSARLQKLTSDIPVEQKKSLTREFHPENDHERDALASALHALKKHKPLINKIKRYCALNNKQKIFDKISYYVLSKRVSISLASKLLENTEDKEFKQIKTEIDTTPIDQYKLSIFESYNKVIDDNELLKTENKELRVALSTEKKRNQRLLSKSAKDTIDFKVRNKTEYIRKLETELQNYKHQLASLEKELEELNKEIPKNHIIAKRIAWLGKKPLREKSKYFSILAHDILYVDDPSSISPGMLENFKGNNITIIAKHPPEELKKHFTVLNEDSIKMHKTRHFCFLQKESFFNTLNNKDILRRVIQDYREERQ
ncbi:MAG: DUF460 domain-containing protein, partial [Nanoarchaeota archaeon]